MNIEEFVSEDNHMCNLGQELFCEIFEPGAIYDLSDNEFNRKIVYWLSQYLVGNLRKVRISHQTQKNAYVSD
ncbi:hypothetical protein ACO1ZG_24650 [Enterobacter kobei]|uniref:hypothetical protein n=1 Tax=Enterobacter kobei TaxID=208224 RepID=UPI003B898404